MIRVSAARRSLATAGSPGLRPTIRGGSSACEISAPAALRTRIERSLKQRPGIDLDGDRRDGAVAIALRRARERRDVV